MRATFVILLVSTIPLVFALRWAVMQSPIAKEDYWVEASWINDRYAILHYHFDHGGFAHVGQDRDYLLDCLNQGKAEICGATRRKTLEVEVPLIAIDGSLLRWHSGEMPEKTTVVRIDPRTLTSSTFKFGYYTPELVGSRYLVAEVGAANGKGVLLSWQDLSDPKNVVHLSAIDVNDFIVPIDGANAFCGAVRVGSSVTQLRLYSMSDDGAKFVCEWPAHWVDGFTDMNIQSKGGLIASISTDASYLEVRDATTGRLLNRFAAPKSHGLFVREYWRLDRGALKVGYDQSMYEMRHGAPISADGVADSNDSHLIMYRFNPENKELGIARNCVIAVRERASGNMVFESPFGGYMDSLRFTSDGTQVKYIDDVGNAVFLDASTGAVLRYVDLLKGFEWKLLAIIVASTMWVALFFHACWKAAVPTLFRSSFLTVAILGFAVYRIHNTGIDEHLWRPAWQIVFGATLTWGIALAIWVVQSNWKLPYRLLIVLLFYQCLYVIWTKLLHRSDLLDLTLICCIWTSILLLCWSLAQFHFGKSRTARKSERQSRPSSTFSVRSLFLWMAIVAGYIAFLMQIPLPSRPPNACLFSSVNSFVAMIVAITTWWSTQRPASRLLIVPPAIAIAIAFETWWTVGRMGAPHFDLAVWFFTCRFGIIAGMVALGFVKLPPAVSRSP